ncbi:MAG TPA: hypothetical protein PLH91_00665 [Tenuifilaceae bacterium]|nr:hypothetical protein [Tenuifilaceae bacterium]HOZ13433.1 hypothetical protein [Tenuifilaceae bacterium]HPI43717.1 hypothetical protein [Tenuifilaceae bacterium]HPN21036.1 hypothetical protein [Tenuifilaceae bacterium]
MISIKHLLVFCTLAFSLSLSAQTTDPEKALKAEKVTFLTNKLQLTADEAKVFWPIYDEYWERKIAIQNERRKFVEEFAKDVDKLSEADIINYTNRYVNSSKQETELLAEFNTRLKTILPPKKIMLLYQSNYDFKDYLLKKVKESRKEEKK